MMKNKNSKQNPMASTEKLRGIEANRTWQLKVWEAMKDSKLSLFSTVPDNFVSLPHPVPYVPPKPPTPPEDNTPTN